MDRHDADYELRGAAPASRLQGRRRRHALPGVEIGEEAFVGAGAVVLADVAPRAVVVGVPARAPRRAG